MPSSVTRRPAAERQAGDDEREGDDREGEADQDVRGVDAELADQATPVPDGRSVAVMVVMSSTLGRGGHVPSCRPGVFVVGPALP